jgi:ergothioneine biosynthesis protein EgtB
MPLLETQLDRLLETRERTEKICQPLQTEDYVIQPVVDVSPPKWHLGHTTWFFEEFILGPHYPGYQIFHEDFSFVFNSYYETVGKRVLRPDRGNLSRPSVREVYNYRHYVTAHLKDLFTSGKADDFRELLEIGIQHEQQHQELLITDIKYILGNNPLFPAYGEHGIDEHPRKDTQTHWIAMAGDIYEIGFRGEGFCFDNELGRHQVLLQDYEIASSPVTNQSMLDFLADGGYTQFDLWHAEGWDWVRGEGIKAPLYWHHIGGKWHYYTLSGLEPVDPAAPLAHISYYEAYALAQWKGCRLPTEFEWEAAQSVLNWGDRWEWTESAYLPYPGYRKASGALGEYNGKFMVNQKVLRGASAATAPGHSRGSYRNFFHPHLRWQFTGLRLAR